MHPLGQAAQPYVAHAGGAPNFVVRLPPEAAITTYAGGRSSVVTLARDAPEQVVVQLMHSGRARVEATDPQRATYFLEVDVRCG